MVNPYVLLVEVVMVFFLGMLAQVGFTKLRRLGKVFVYAYDPRTRGVETRWVRPPVNGAYTWQNEDKQNKIPGVTLQFDPATIMGLGFGGRTVMFDTSRGLTVIPNIPRPEGMRSNPDGTTTYLMDEDGEELVQAPDGFEQETVMHSEVWNTITHTPGEDPKGILYRMMPFLLILLLIGLGIAGFYIWKIYEVMQGNGGG